MIDSYPLFFLWVQGLWIVLCYERYIDRFAYEIREPFTMVEFGEAIVRVVPMGKDEMDIV